MGLFDSVKRGINEVQAKADAEARAQEYRRAQIAKVALSTGDLKSEYEIVDTVFAMDSHQAGIWTAASADKAFDGVKSQLRARGFDLGATAVIACQFEYRVSVGKGLFGSAQCIEIFAYGTAVRAVR